MRILPRAAARGDVRNLFVLPRRRRHRRRSRPARRRAARQLQQWRSDIDALYAGAPPPHLTGLAQAVRGFDLQARRFPRRHRRHGDGCARRHPRARLRDARSLLRPCRLRGRPPLGARVRHGAPRPALRSRITSAARCNSPISCATSTRMRRSAASICRARNCRRPASRRPIRPRSLPRPAIGKPAAPSSSWRETEFAKRERDHGAKPAPHGAGAAHHGRGLSAHPRSAGRARLCAAARPGSPAAREIRSHRAAQSRLYGPHRPHHRRRSCRPCRCAETQPPGGHHVVVHEATAFAGGRCRSYHDAALGMTIDNGNHLLLSGNHAALDYLRDIGAEDRLIGPPAAEFPFVDLTSDESWTLRINDGRLPWWIFDANRRVPGTRVFRLSGAGAAVCGRRRARPSATSSAARARSISGWSSRCCSRRSTSSRRAARRSSPPP